jgi:hypothetical protein
MIYHLRRFVLSSKSRFNVHSATLDSCGCFELSEFPTVGHVFVSVSVRVRGITPPFFLERSHLSISSAMAEALGLDKKHFELYVSNEFNPSTADGATFALDASLCVH